MQPLTRLPRRFDASTLPAVMAAIGLPLPKGADLLPGLGLPIAASGARFSEAQVSDALDKTRLSIQDRLAVKIALSQHHLLGRRA